jgi:hypothetical protein
VPSSSSARPRGTLPHLGLRPARDARPVPGVRYNPDSMRQIGRALLSAATMVSLLLCVATVALWVRSYWVCDMYAADARDRWHLFAWSSRGVAGVDRVRPSDFTAERMPRGLSHHAPPPPNLGPVVPPPKDPGVRSRFALGSVSWYRTEGGSVRTLTGPFSFNVTDFYPAWHLTVPLWLTAAILGLLPCVRTTLFLRRRSRRGPGLCPSCGYDLRGSPGRCPECGTIAS